MEETLKHLDALLKEGRTGDVLKDVNDILQQEWKRFSSEYLAELHALRGMASYRRKEFEDARTDFRFSLDADPSNERALYGMAYLAAYVDKDPAKTKEWMAKLPESAARDNAHMIVMRSKEYMDANGLFETDEEVNALLGKWTKPNPSDPLNVANVMHNGGRFYITFADRLIDAGASESSYPYSWAVGCLACAIGFYGTGDTNLHHRAAAHYWMSVAMEKLCGPAAAISFAERSLELWKRQLELDPTNTHFEQNYENAMARVDELKENAYSLERRGY